MELEEIKTLSPEIVQYFIEKEREANKRPGSQGGKIFELMPKIAEEIEAVKKEHQNEGKQRFRYRGIDDVYNAVHKIMSKHGVFPTTQILESNRSEKKFSSGTVGHYVIQRCRVWFYASDGSWVWHEVEGEGLDTGDKATNKAGSYCQKYAIMRCFSIPTDDLDDGDAENVEDKNGAIVHNDQHQSRQQQYTQNPNEKVTQPQLKRLFAIGKKNGWSAEDLKNAITEIWNIKMNDLTKKRYNWLVDKVSAMTPDHFGEQLNLQRGLTGGQPVNTTTSEPVYEPTNVNTAEDIGDTIGAPPSIDKEIPF